MLRASPRDARLASPRRTPGKHLRKKCSGCVCLSLGLCPSLGLSVAAPGRPRRGVSRGALRPTASWIRAPRAREAQQRADTVQNISGTGSRGQAAWRGPGSKPRPCTREECLAGIRAGARWRPNVETYPACASDQARRSRESGKPGPRLKDYNALRRLAGGRPPRSPTPTSRRHRRAGRRFARRRVQRRRRPAAGRGRRPGRGARRLTVAGLPVGRPGPANHTTRGAAPSAAHGVAGCAAGALAPRIGARCCPAAWSACVGESVATPGRFRPRRGAPGGGQRMCSSPRWRVRIPRVASSRAVRTASRCGRRRGR
jgi:hypothetical protein